MRRPRSKLQVTTFPFLAVLLCAMGSLLLLLFIMDRRGKIAAKYRVAEELQARKERTKAEEEARQAEWQKARQQLHLALAGQQDQLAKDAKGLGLHIGDASNKVALTQAKQAELDEKVQKEAAKISLLQFEIANQNASLQQADKKVAMSKAEQFEAVKELAELERAFQQLRALRERDKSVHSVVPYRGKRGDMRPPIYIECVRDGVVFHPDKKPLQGWDFTPDGLRSEIERRFGSLGIQNVAAEKSSAESKGPYVLFLVRPSGIGSYYKAQSALKGRQAEFGYELVDEGWQLDFGGDTYAKNAPPTRAPVPWKRDDEGQPGITPLPPPALAQNGGSMGGPPLAQNRGSPGGPLQTPPFGVPLSGGNGGGAPGLGVVVGGALRPPPPAQNGGSTGGPSLAPPAGVPQPGGNGGGSPGSGAVGIGLPVLPSPPTGFTGPGALAGGPPLQEAPKSPGGDVGGPSKPPSFVPIGKSPQGAGGSGATSQGGVSPINVPIPGNNVGGSRGTTGSGSPDGGGTPGDPSGKPVGSGSPDGGGTSGDSIGKSFPGFGGNPGKKAPTAPPLSRLLGNKDFPITIACRGDYVTISPGNLTYRWTASNAQAVDQALAESVKNLIARRQASVRPGEPPYRPLIQFQVFPDGLQSFHHTHPLLSNLGVTMTRENVAE